MICGQTYSLLSTVRRFAARGAGESFLRLPSDLGLACSLRAPTPTPPLLQYLPCEVLFVRFSGRIVSTRQSPIKAAEQSLALVRHPKS